MVNPESDVIAYFPIVKIQKEARCFVLMLYKIHQCSVVSGQYYRHILRMLLPIHTLLQYNFSVH